MIVFIIIIHVWCVQLILIIFFFIFLFTVKWKWFQRRQFSIWPKTKSLREYNGQKNTVTFCHCWYVCTSAYIVIFTPSIKPSVCDEKQIILHCLFFLFLEVFIYCTFRLQNVWHSFHYDSIMPSNLYLVINTKFCGYIY